MHSFLFELGTEELPDNVILPALKYLEAELKKTLAEMRLESSQCLCGSTPRRLALLVKGLPEKQADQELYKKGPALNIAYDGSGQLSPAGLGFLKKSGATADAIFVDQDAKGEFIAVRYTQAGKSSQQILVEWLQSAVYQMPLPKSMIWQDGQPAFSRPVRWLVALWDSQVLPLELFGLKSDRYSQPNRFMGLDARLELPAADSYFESLKAGCVVADQQARKIRIKEQLATIFAGQDYYVGEDERLLDTVCNLVEYPTAVIGKFDAKFLDLPEKVITSTISQNQKYFSVFDLQQRLSNQFVFIMNGEPAWVDKIRKGNEKVVHARLEDALWFYNEDLKKPLDSYAQRLDEVVFQSRLGTLQDKSKRVIALSGYIADTLRLPLDAKERAIRTAQLCKADLLTLMLGEKEFTRLQGYIGQMYALAGGEDAEVAQGIYEHYMPRGGNDGLPESLSGAICAVADKMDTVAGIIGVGILPTGSQDPFALRRAANGVVQILAQRKWQLNLDDLILKIVEILAKEIQLEADTVEKLREFFELRVNWLLKEMGIAYDVVASVMHAQYISVDDLICRAQALDALKKREDFIRLVIGFKRVANIIKDSATFAPLNETLLMETAEKELLQALNVLKGELTEALQELDYPVALQKLISFGLYIDRFFDDVLVNCEDQALRANRYALLAGIRQEFMRVSDLSLIVVE